MKKQIVRFIALIMATSVAFTTLDMQAFAMDADVYLNQTDDNLSNENTNNTPEVTP